MAEKRVHQGGCHCGKVRFEAKMDLSKALSCNCSICQKRGALWSFVPAQQFKVLSGQDELADYQFNRHVIHHLFCRTCGISPFSRARNAEGGEGVGINVRCLDDVDLDALEISFFDGRSL